jgi:hypothetical protein
MYLDRGITVNNTIRGCVYFMMCTTPEGRIQFYRFITHAAMNLRHSQ